MEDSRHCVCYFAIYKGMCVTDTQNKRLLLHGVLSMQECFEPFLFQVPRKAKGVPLDLRMFVVSDVMASTCRSSFFSFTTYLSVFLLRSLHCITAFLTRRLPRNITCSPKHITICCIFPHLVPFHSHSNHSSS